MYRIKCWSSTLYPVHIVKFTVPWEDAEEEAYKRKPLKHAELAANSVLHDWKTKGGPVEVDCRGLPASPKQNYTPSFCYFCQHSHHQ